MKLKVVEVIDDLFDEVVVVVGDTRTGNAETFHSEAYDELSDEDRTAFNDWLPEQELEGTTDMRQLFFDALNTFMTNKHAKEEENA